MATDDEAKAAITAMDGAEFNGRRLRVNEAEERRPGGPRGPGGPGGPRPARPDVPPGSGLGVARPKPWETGGGGGVTEEKKRYEKKNTRRRHDDEADFGGPRRGGRLRHDLDDED